jgi:hypothetical protein
MTPFVSIVYRQAVDAIQTRLTFLERQPTLARCLAIGAAYLFGNTLGVGALTVAGVWLAARLTNVPALLFA